MSFSGGSSASPSIYFASDTNTGIFSPAADTIAFGEGGAEAMRIDSSGNLLVGITSARANAGDVQVSKGISFPATQSAQSDANTLDDYEEGTWTPATSSSGYTISSSSGGYTKVGRLVHCRFNVTFSAVGVGNSSASISGFPFTNSSNPTPGSGRDNTSTGAIYVCSIDSSSASGPINSYSNGVVNGSARTFTTGENYIFSITYQI
jgi:hypothetical protein